MFSDPDNDIRHSTKHGKWADGWFDLRFEDAVEEAEFCNLYCWGARQLHCILCVLVWGAVGGLAAVLAHEIRAKTPWTTYVDFDVWGIALAACLATAVAGLALTYTLLAIPDRDQYRRWISVICVASVFAICGAIEVVNTVGFRTIDRHDSCHPRIILNTNPYFVNGGSQQAFQAYLDPNSSTFLATVVFQLTILSLCAVCTRIPYRWGLVCLALSWCFLVTCVLTASRNLTGENTRFCVYMTAFGVGTWLLMGANLRSSEIFARGSYVDRRAHMTLSRSFIASFSHELRTPLNSILGSQQTLDAALSDGAVKLPPQAERCISRIATSGELLLSLINDILDMSSIEYGQFQLQPETFEVRAEAQLVIDLMHEHCARAGLDAVLEVADEVPILMETDRTRLRQVLLNLLTNAIKFTPEGWVSVTITLEAGASPVVDKAKNQRRAFLSPSVVVHCAGAGGNDGSGGGSSAAVSSPRLRVAVRDTGIGVSDEDAERIFNFSERAGQRTKPGCGYGLAICKGIVHRLGGAIGVISEGIGHGSEFWFTMECNRSDLKLADGVGAGAAGGLAAATASLASSETGAGRVAGTRRGSGGSVLSGGGSRELADALRASCAGRRALIVDDDPFNVDVLSDFITIGAGMVCEASLSATSALEKLRQPGAHFDVILMDVQMPQTDGLECTQLIRRLEVKQARAHCPIIGVTASNIRSIHDECIESGMDDVLAKPIRRNDMIKYLANLFSEQGRMGSSE